MKTDWQWHRGGIFFSLICKPWNSCVFVVVVFVLFFYVSFLCVCRSMQKLTQLERLDLGSNEFTEVVSIFQSVCHCSGLSPPPSLICSLSYFCFLSTYVESFLFLTLWTMIPHDNVILFFILACSQLRVFSFLHVQPEVVEQLTGLKELWMDGNKLTFLPGVSYTLIFPFSDCCVLTHHLEIISLDSPPTPQNCVSPQVFIKKSCSQFRSDFELSETSREGCALNAILS